MVSQGLLYLACFDSGEPGLNQPPLVPLARLTAAGVFHMGCVLYLPISVRPVVLEEGVGRMVATRVPRARLGIAQSGSYLLVKTCHGSLSKPSYKKEKD